MNHYLLVFVGGGIGSMLRLGTYRLSRLWFPAEFPWGTFSVNVIGGLLAGLLTGWLAGRAEGASEAPAIFLMTGILGGFTTFSAFTVEAVLMWQRGEMLSSACYVLASVVLAIIGVATGLFLMRPA